MSESPATENDAPKCWPKFPCNWFGCDRDDYDHHQVVIYTNSAGNIAVRRDAHI